MKTAVDWLVDQLKQQGFLYDLDIEVAKEKEKEQIMTANIEGTEHGYRERAVFGLDARPYSKKRAKDYYNETYNK